MSITKIIGVTGPTGAGKTTLLLQAEKLGGAAIDCDLVYHEMLESDIALQESLEAMFGPLRDESGVVDRKKLGTLVFGDPGKMAQLNAVAQRATVDRTRQLVEEYRRQGRELVVIDAFALMESGLGELCDFTIAVVAPPEVRVARIMAREGISEEYAWARVRAQRPNEYYAAACGYTLVNDCAAPEEFSRRARALLCELLERNTES